MIGKKQASTQADWVAAWEQAVAEQDKARADKLLDGAAGRIERRARRAKKAAVGWSGGKDSMALHLAAQRAGITDSVLVVSELEYPAFTDWVADNAPDGLHIEVRHKLNLEWLADHPGWIFPQDAKTAGKWFAAVQHAGQRDYCARTGTDLFLMGRRRADGNFLGKTGKAGAEYVDRAKFIRFSPLWDWSHEDILCVLACYNPLPPFYFWPNGFKVGTGPWPARQWTGSVEQGWKEVAAIDPTVVDAAIEAGVPGAHK